MQKIKTYAPYVIGTAGLLGAILSGYNFYITSKIRQQFGSGVIQVLTNPVAIQALQVANEKYMAAQPITPKQEVNKK